MAWSLIRPLSLAHMEPLFLLGLGLATAAQCVTQRKTLSSGNKNDTAKTKCQGERPDRLTDCK